MKTITLLRLTRTQTIDDGMGTIVDERPPAPPGHWNSTAPPYIPRGAASILRFAQTGGAGD